MRKKKADKKEDVLVKKIVDKDLKIKVIEKKDEKAVRNIVDDLVDMKEISKENII